MYNVPYLYLVDKAQSMKYSDDFYNVSKPCFDWYLKIIATLEAKNQSSVGCDCQTGKYETHSTSKLFWGPILNFDSEKRKNIGSKTGQAGTGVGLPDRGCTSQLLRLTCLPVGRNEGRDSLAVEHRGSGSLTKVAAVAAAAAAAVEGPQWRLPPPRSSDRQPSKSAVASTCNLPLRRQSSSARPRSL